LDGAEINIGYVKIVWRQGLAGDGLLCVLTICFNSVFLTLFWWRFEVV
jgi:hypothetical protein